MAKVFSDVCIALRPPLEIVWFVHPGVSVGARLPWDASLGNTSELQMAEDGIVRHRWHRWRRICNGVASESSTVAKWRMSNTSMSKKR